MKNAFVTGITILTLLVSSLYAQDSVRKIVKIDLSEKQQLAVSNLFKLGIDITQFSKSGEYANALVTQTELDAITALGFATATLLEDADAFARQLRQEGYLDHFHNYAEMLSELQAVAATHSDIAILQDIGDSYDKTKGWGGYDIWALKISDNVATDEDEPEALFMANIHAREIITPEVILYFMHYLIDNYGSDPFVTYLVDNREIWLIPMINPDGHEYCFSGSGNPAIGNDPIWWRKNKRDNNNNGVFDPNYDGVDLNRNFGYMWGYDDNGSSPFPWTATYRGPAAFSEPETQTIRDFAESHNFVVSLSFHSYGRWWLFPWGYDVQNPDTPDHAQFVALSDSCVAYNGYVAGNGLTIGYPVNGDSDDWLYGEQITKPKIFAFTPEVGNTAESIGGNTGFFPDTLYIEKQILENQGPLFYMAYAAGENPIIESPPMPDTEDAVGPYTVHAFVKPPILLTEAVGIDESKIKVFYNTSGVAPFDSLFMAATGTAHEYSAEIPGQGNDVTMYYYFSATDSLGRTGYAPRTPEKSLLSFNVRADTIPPVITHNPISDQSYTTTTFKIMATVTDNSGIAEVEVQYRRNGGDIDSVQMSATQSADEYEAYVTPDTVVAGDLFEYRIVATDIAQNANITADPAIGFYSFSILLATVFDFEIDDGNFATVVPSDWEWGAPSSGPGSAHSGINVWATGLDGNYGDLSDSRLDTPPIDLTGIANATLSFWHWYLFEYSQDTFWDGGNVKISVDGGPFEIIEPVDGYDCVITDFNETLGDEPAFGGPAENGNFWHQEFFDLSPYANSTVVIRFHFGSDVAVNEPGWYLDDVQVSLNPTEAPLITHTTQLPNTSDNIGPYLVRAKITDNSALTTASILYSTDSGVNYNEVAMAVEENDMFRGEIPGQPYGTTVWYYVQATDDSGNVATDPVNAPVVYYSFFVTDRVPQISVAPNAFSLSMMQGEVYFDSLVVSNSGLLELTYTVGDSLLSGPEMAQRPTAAITGNFKLPLNKIIAAAKSSKYLKNSRNPVAVSRGAVTTDLECIIVDQAGDIFSFNPAVPPGVNPDIVAVYAENDGTNLTFEIEFTNPVTANAFSALISLDLDQDMNTGGFPPQTLVHDIGVEIELLWDNANVVGSQLGLTSGHLFVMDYGFVSIFGFTPIIINGTKMSATVPLALIGDDDNNMNLGVMAVPNVQNPQWGDTAPEVGHAVLGSEQGVNWLTVYPTEGTLGAEDSAFVYFSVNGAVIAPGEYTAAIIFSSNDPLTPEEFVPLTLTVTPTAVDNGDGTPLTPETFSLRQNYPNPFNPATTIAYQLPHAAQVILTVYNMIGQRVATLVNERKAAGYYNCVWDGRDVSGVLMPSGIYLLRLEAGSYTRTIKMLFLQ